MTKSEFVQVMKGVTLLIDFRNDFQFDPESPDYLGFLNTGVPLLSDEDGETFRFIVRNKDLYLELIEKLGLSTEHGLDEEETVFVLSGEMAIKNFRSRLKFFS
jgi:hypothetical protein